MCKIHQVWHGCGHTSYRIYSHCRRTVRHTSGDPACCCARGGSSSFLPYFLSRVNCGGCQFATFMEEWESRVDDTEMRLRKAEEELEEAYSNDATSEETLKQMKVVETLNVEQDEVQDRWNQEAWRLRQSFPPSAPATRRTLALQRPCTSHSPLRHELHPEDIEERVENSAEDGWVTVYPDSSSTMDHEGGDEEKQPDTHEWCEVAVLDEALEGEETLFISNGEGRENFDQLPLSQAEGMRTTRQSGQPLLAYGPLSSAEHPDTCNSTCESAVNCSGSLSSSEQNLTPSPNSVEHEIRTQEGNGTEFGAEQPTQKFKFPPEFTAWVLSIAEEVIREDRAEEKKRKETSTESNR
ncbi:hypothetical protein NA57DRAFT_54456 [Rhizodiscina lignyota]|uniref:Uncharacterized protein n=1 Tax=Rhizodiscina lignyota TaxID=1504668 RepID=A0A9P4M7F1_9PEZI|nr:hypothetical protein NA57DRAFT_54456 [Rhizodiscina lignyota]